MGQGKSKAFDAGGNEAAALAFFTKATGADTATPGIPTPPDLPTLPNLPDAPSAPTAPNAAPPEYKQPALDPLFQLLMQNSQQDNINELMKRARDDQGLILARYGTRLAQAGTGTGSPLLAR